eukprot:TRINITY_DN2026_c0_g1_i2.p1 TRINITY_DN2026_c0_g1~~TRINITY_DN2026_c0_g1_i2.p1  ORF type:complete len:114 (+),score=17.33 TRINITY_DN2026_c0_g1_i2:127-468(+)
MSSTSISLTEIERTVNDLNCLYSNTKDSLFSALQRVVSNGQLKLFQISELMFSQIENLDSLQLTNNEDKQKRKLLVQKINAVMSDIDNIKEKLKEIGIHINVTFVSSHFLFRT